ncbi:MAG: M48 family metallopeptidase [Thermodesulfovibrionales bacterium]|nr:M48 family metallopeptidase [Thermodesulfovibrionales bacterium]
MRSFEGKYLDGKSSKAIKVSIMYDTVFLYIQGTEEVLHAKHPLSKCILDPPLGSTARTVRFPDGSLCETDELEAMERLQEFTRQNRGLRLVHLLERSWRMAFISLVALVLFTWGFIEYGIPALAYEVTKAVPAAISERISSETLELLDRKLLEPSALTEERTDEIQSVFSGMIQETGIGDHYRLLLRNSPLFGPNALALPSGQIVMTDQLVELSINNAELKGILLHEVAHVELRHGLRSIVQNAGVFLLVSILVGDLTSITSAAGTLPTVLTQTGYSRDFEREADSFAKERMIQMGLGTKPLLDILHRMTINSPEMPGESIYSTHPVIKERLQYLEEQQGP